MITDNDLGSASRLNLFLNYIYNCKFGAGKKFLIKEKFDKIKAQVEETTVDYDRE